MFALIRNELHLDGKGWPFDATSGTVTTANGKVYDLADGKQRQALMDVGIVYYLDQMVEGTQADTAQDGTRVGIERAHIEEDTGKMVHVGGSEGRIAGATHSLVDFNRAGTGLMELVSEPDIRTPEEARRFAQKLRLIFLTLGVDGNVVLTFCCTAEEKDRMVRKIRRLSKVVALEEHPYESELLRKSALIRSTRRLTPGDVAGETSFLTSELVKQDAHGWIYFLAGSPSELDPVLERLETAGIVTDIVYSILGV